MLSSKTGFVICLTDIALISCVERKEKEAPSMVEEMGFVMSIVGTRKGWD